MITTRTLAGALVSSCLLLAGTAFAADTMSKDTMGKDSMGKSAMSKDSTGMGMSKGKTADDKNMQKGDGTGAGAGIATGKTGTDMKK